MILNEVFECDEPDALVKRGEAFFSMLPEPNVRTPLAESSPLNSEALHVGDAEQPVAPDAPKAARR